MPKKQSVSSYSSSFESEEDGEVAEDEQSELSLPDDIIAQDTEQLHTLLTEVRDALAIADEKLQPLL